MGDTAFYPVRARTCSPARSNRTSWRSFSERRVGALICATRVVQPGAFLTGLPELFLHFRRGQWKRNLIRSIQAVDAIEPGLIGKWRIEIVRNLHLAFQTTEAAFRSVHWFSLNESVSACRGGPCENRCYVNRLH